MGIKTADRAGLDFVLYIHALNVIQHLFRGIIYKKEPLDFIKRKTRKMGKASKKANEDSKEKEEEESASTKAHPTHRMHKATRQIVLAMLKHELHRSDPKQFKAIPNIVKYIEETIHFYCEEMTQVKVDWYHIHDARIGLYKFVRKLLLDAECGLRWFKMDILQMLFPNMERLEVVSIYLCPLTLDAILKFCQKNGATRDEEEERKEMTDGDGDGKKNKNGKGNGNGLQKIVVYRPSKVDCMESATDNEHKLKEVADEHKIDNAVNEYGGKFEECGWKLEKKSKQEMYITRL